MSNPFGLKCKDVTAALDLGTLSPARQAFAGEAARGDLERLNEELLKKHGR